MDDFYDQSGSLVIESYDAFYSQHTPVVAGDIDFYSDLASASKTRVLEVACGTGRVLIPLAQRGIRMTGTDASQAMLQIAERKLDERDAVLPVTLVHQSMQKLSLDSEFDVAIVAFRSFQHLLTVDEQVETLVRIKRHLSASGRLALHLFDPRFDLLLTSAESVISECAVNAATGGSYERESRDPQIDYVRQRRIDRWRYRERDASGKTVREETHTMMLRWTFRYELAHLLKRCGFEVEAEYSDFGRSAPAYGKELIVVARPA